MGGSQLMDDFTESAGFQQLLGDIKSLRTDTAWMRKQMTEQASTVKDLDARVRDLEQSVARIEAKTRPVTPWPSIVAVVVSIIVATIAILDRIYAP